LRLEVLDNSTDAQQIGAENPAIAVWLAIGALMWRGL